MNSLKTLIASHPAANKKMAKFVRIAAYCVLAFAVTTTGLYLESKKSSTPIDQDVIDVLIVLAGCILGFIIAALEYAFIEALKHRWGTARADNRITSSEWIVLVGLLLLLAIVLAVDAISTTQGAERIGFSKAISWSWGIGQLFAFEFLLHMSYFLEDAAHEEVR